MGKKYIRHALIGVLAAVCAVYGLWLSAETALGETGTYLDAAKARYGIDQVIEAKSAGAIARAFEKAEKKAGAGNRVIVHVPDGNYKIAGSTFHTKASRTIPANVLLVAEQGAVFTASTDLEYIFRVKGSLYGGQFDGRDKNVSCLRFEETTFKDDNGIIEKAVVRNAFKEGILAMHKKCRNAQVIGCDVSLSGENGISCMDGAYIALIDRCNTHDNGFKDSTGQFGSGINISHADVGTISACTIKRNADKAVSTNSDPGAGYKQPGCTIDAIRDCKITGNKTNGVYIKPNCTLNSFTGNTLSGNKDGLVASGKTLAGTKGKAVIRNVSGNTFKSSKNCQITSGNKGAVIYIKNDNQITDGKKDGIFAKESGVVKITGENNLISGNKQSGILAEKSARVVISGGNNRIARNKASGVYLCDKGKFEVTGAGNIIEKSKTYGIGAKAGSKVTITGANTVIKSNGVCGIYLDNKSRLIFTGKGGQVNGNKGFGLYARNKSKATLKNVSFSGNKNKAVYTKNGSTVTGGPAA